jgi:hypothetical protein
MGNPYTQNLQQTVNPILDIIYQLESNGGTNKEAYKENKFGAMGGYQIRRSTYNEIKKMNPDKWGRLSFEQVAADDNLSRQAAGDYVNWIQNFYTSRNIPTSIETTLLGYHSGVGNVVKGKIGKEGVNYVKKAREIMYPKE